MAPRRSARKATKDMQDVVAADASQGDTGATPAGAVDDAHPTVAPVRRSARKKATSTQADDASSAGPSQPKRTSKRTKASPAQNEPASQDQDAHVDKTKVAASSSKPKLKRTLSSDDVANKPKSKKAKKEDPDEQVKGEAEKKKMVTIMKRGAAPVDPCSGYTATHQVYVSPDGEVWDAMLNQTNIGKNANKFYVIQLLHPIGNADNCLLFVRWGRTGENGASQAKGPWASPLAINEFKKQFRNKTSVPWESRKGMQPVPGKYTFLERDFEDIGSKDDKTKPKSSAKPASVRIPDSKLQPQVQALCRFIFNTGFIDAALSSMNYDANKLPLGKLSKSTILQGFSALKALSEVIDGPSKAAQYGGYDTACSELSSRYYSVIPHVFGRNKPIVISTMPQLKRELELVDALGDMEIAQKLIEEKTTNAEDPVNPIDVRFKCLDLESMVPVAQDSKEFDSLTCYARDTHGSAHAHYSVSIEHAFRVKRKHEDRRWSDAGFSTLKEGQRLLLWHGSRSTNFAGILSQGLRIAPPEAPVNGYMFGKGVYFADMMSKSYNYCYANSSGNMGILLLCDVAAKPCHELVDASYTAGEDCKKNGKLATKGLGAVAPDEWKDAGEALNNEELKGCLMPASAAKTQQKSGGYLQYNEYIVYDVSQIRVKYLLMMKMK